MTIPRLSRCGPRAVLCVALLGAGFGSADALADLLDDIVEKGSVRIAVPNDFPPFGAAIGDGQLEGYDIEVAKLLAEDLGVRFDPVVAKSVNRIPLLLSHEADLVISCLGISPARARGIAFSSPYGPFFSGVYGPPEVAVAGPEDLAGKRVAVTRDTIEDAELGDLATQGMELVRFDDNAQTFSAYLSGEADLLATGNTAITSLLRQDPQRAIESKFVLRQSPCSIGVRHGEPRLLHWVNVFILDKKLGGELDRLSRQWLGEPLQELPSL